MNWTIEQLNWAGQVFVGFGGAMLIQSSILICFLVLLELFSRKRVRAVFRYCMWMLVLVKLVLPTSLSLPTGLGYWLGQRFHAAVDRPVIVQGVQESPVITMHQPATVQLSDFAPPAAPAADTVRLETPATLTWQGIVLLIYLAIVAAMVLLLIQRARFVAGLIRQANTADQAMRDLLRSCCRQLGIRQPTDLKLSANLTSPAVCGLFRPVILVPEHLSVDLDRQQLRTVLLHELAHIRRGDLWVNLFQTILQIVYFYNPLLWLANVIIRRVREQAVDEMVLVAMGEKAQQYPDTLINLAKLALARPALSLRLIGVVESKSALTGRIKHILNRPMPKTAKLGLLGTLAVVITATILLPMARAESKPTDTSVHEKNLLRVYQVNRSVADFPVKEDLSTPEAAYAAVNRIAASGKLSAWRDVSVKRMVNIWPKDGKEIKVDPAWAAALLNARIKEVRAFNNTHAIVIARLLPASSLSLLKEPFDVRIVEFENGRWLNAGNNRFGHIAHARRELERRVRQFMHRDPLKHTKQVKQAARQLFEKIRNVDYDAYESRDAWKKFPINYTVSSDYPNFVKWICKTFKNNSIVSVELGKVFVDPEVIILGQKSPIVPYKLTLEDGTVLEGNLPFNYELDDDTAHWHGWVGIDWHHQSKGKLGKKFSTGWQGNSSIRFYDVDRNVSQFPEKEDFSTPEAAYATINHLTSIDHAAWARISVRKVAQRFPRTKKQTTKVDAEWADLMQHADILKVWIWKNAYAVVAARLPQEFSSRLIVKLIDVRSLELEDGRWLNHGNDRVDTLRQAGEKFDKGRQLRQKKTQIVDDKLGLAKAKSETTSVYIPDADTRDTNVVLDLASGQLPAGNNSIQAAIHVPVTPSDVAITSYSRDVRVFPEAHLLKMKVALSLTSRKQGVTRLSFKLRDQFEVERITQSDNPLQFSQDGWNVTVEGIQVAQDAPPLIWEYQGTFKPPFKSDSMEDVIVYADEIRLTSSSHWYPKPLWSSQFPIEPSSRLLVEVPATFSVVSGDRQEYPPRRRNDRIEYRYISNTNGSGSFAAAQYARTSIPWKNKTLEAYFFPKKLGQKPQLLVKQLPQEEKDVLDTLKDAKNILDFYSHKFGPYPWSKFSLVQKSNHAVYAYGAQTYVVMNSLSHVGEITLAHEIAHQWWGNLINPVGQGERWLTESLAEYSAFLYMEHAHGSKEVVGDGPEFLLGQMQNMHPIRKTSFNTPDYDNIIYHIGPHVFHMLRYVVGDEQFANIMKDFTRKYMHKNPTVADFIEVAENVYKKPLAWFFNQWLDRTKNPAFVLESEIIKQSDNTFLVKGTIAQHNTNYRMPLEIEIIGKNRKDKRRIWVQGPTTPFEYPIPYKPSQVKFTEEMTFWILAGFFHGEQERLAVPKRRPKPRSFGSIDELFNSIRKKIVVELPYKLGSEIKLELDAEQAARLDCADNPYGHKEILICPMEGNLYAYTFYTDGKFSGGGKSLALGRASYYTRALNVIVWEIENNKAHIKFHTETDKVKIKQILKEKYIKRGIPLKEVEKMLKHSGFE